MGENGRIMSIELIFASVVVYLLVGTTLAISPRRNEMSIYNEALALVLFWPVFVVLALLIEIGFRLIVLPISKLKGGKKK